MQLVAVGNFPSCVALAYIATLPITIAVRRRRVPGGSARTGCGQRHCACAAILSVYASFGVVRSSLRCALVHMLYNDACWDLVHMLGKSSICCIARLLVN